MADGIVLRVLGPVETWSGSGWRVSGTPQMRLVLGLLALQARQTVPASQLIDALWGDYPPRSVRNSLNVLLTHLRKILTDTPGAALIRVGDSIQLQADPVAVDVHRFRKLVRGARAAQDGQAAIAMFDEALALWRGPALAGVADTMRAVEIRDGLAEEHLSVTEYRIDALLACGRHAEAAAELPLVLSEHPLREGVAGMLMLALYRCGRQADALTVFRGIRERLIAELGIEPGTDLRQLHQQILVSDPELTAPPREGRERTADGIHEQVGQVPVPRQLPAAVPHFTGRTAELKVLDGLLDESGSSGAMEISAISGAAGVGKTALALRWAHQVVNRFPDGQLYVNLRGFGPSGTPATPAEAVRGFLDAFAVPAGRIPGSLDAQTALYRSFTAGKRMLVLLDNARDEQQVRPLLPASARCVVLVTSRSQLTGVIAAEGAVPIVLDVLAETEARELLACRMGTERVNQEPAAAAELIRLCVRLPLALSVVSARAAVQPRQTLAAVAGELRRTRSRLDALGTGDAVSDVRAVFSWSYGALSEPAARTFGLLGIHPGPDVSIPAASSLTAIPADEIACAFAELTRVHLVSEHVPGRFTFHDLLRAYAAEQAQTGQKEGARAAALRRMLDHYLHSARSAALLLNAFKDACPPGKPATGSAPEEPACYAEAWAWFEAEHRVLRAIIGQAVEAGLENDASQLSWLLSDFLDLRGYWHDWADLQRTVLAAARRATDHVGEARSHRDLGYACVRLGSYAEARHHLGRALVLAAGMDDLIGQARAHYALAQAAEEEDCHEEALGHAERALSLYSVAAHRAGQARALNAVGWYRAHLGDAAGAVEFCQQALVIQRDLGDGPAQADTLDSLGYAYLRLGRHAQAVGCYRDAARVYGQFSIKPSQAHSLTSLGDLHHGAGDLEAAIGCWRQALAIFETLGHPGAGQIRARLSSPPPCRRATWE